MGRSILQKANTDGSTITFPLGRIRNNPGDGTGTPLDEQSYGDMHQFFDMLMYRAGLVHNGLPENDANGYQFNDALDRLMRMFIIVNNADPGAFGVTVGRMPTLYSIYAGPTPGFRSGTVFPGDYDGAFIVVKCKNIDGITLTPDGTDTIDGVAAPISLAMNETVELVWDADNTDWIIKTEQKVRTKIIEIGGWDMDSSALLNVAHGLTASKIRSVRAMVRDDIGNYYTPIMTIVGNSPVGGGTVYWDSTNISLRRFSNAEGANIYAGSVVSAFDNASYSSTLINRGFITIEYAP